MLWLQDIENELRNLTSFNKFWINQTGRSWTDYIYGNEPMDILIDEAQMLYGHVPFFWNNLKGLMQRASHNKKPLLRVLLLSMYGEPRNSGNNSTPIDFPVTLGLEYLRLSRVEY